MGFLIREKLNKIKTIQQDIRNCLGHLDNIDSFDIHYGYWDKQNNRKISNQEMVKAQKNLSNLVISVIPKDAKLVLDIGGGFGGFSDYLLNKGFSPLCVVPDKKLINFGKNKFPSVKFLLGSAEFFNARNKYDAAVLIESLQYFSHKEKAIKNLANHLKSKSTIIILDEFSHFLETGLPHEGNLINLLKSLGFNVSKNRDISKNVLPTCDFVSKYFLEKDLKMSHHWKAKEQFYLNKKQVYKLLVFDKI